MTLELRELVKWISLKKRKVKEVKELRKAGTDYSTVKKSRICLMLTRYELRKLMG